MKTRILFVLVSCWFVASATTAVCIKVRAKPVFDEKVETVEGIPLGAPGEPKFVVWGDSHAAALRNLFDALGKQYGIAGQLFAGRGTPPLRDAYSPHAKMAEYDQELRAARIIDWIIDRKIPHIFLVARWECRAPRWVPKLSDEELKKDWAGLMLRDEETDNPGTEDACRVLRNALESTLIDLSSHYRTTYFVMQAPVKDGRDGSVPVSEATYKLQQSEVTKYFNGLHVRFDVPTEYARMKEMPVVLGPGKWWFKDGMCLTRDEGGDYYSDRHHVSAHGADRLFRPLLEPAFQEMKHALTPSGN